MKTLKFENVGMGIAVAADWFDVGGASKWVDFTSSSEGRGKRRTWSVTANHYAAGPTGTRVSITKRDCYRYEAAELAFLELKTFLENSGAPSRRTP